MPECEYCGESFDDEAGLLEHMGERHEGELGRIDQRRVAQHHGDSDAGLPPTVIYGVVGVVLVGIVLGGVYAAITVFDGSAPERVHEHGTINMTVDGERMAFSSSQYTSPTDFHFHGSGPVWHMHPQDPGRLTLAEAMDRLGIEVTEDRVTVEGETYRADDPATEVVVEVDGESVDPTEYELHGEAATSDAEQGDHVRIVVESSA